MNRRVLELAMLALVVLAFAAACLHGIANHWQWGHNGYNGAAFSQAARNTLRFGVWGQARYHTGFSPPPRSEIYVRHPQLLHLHLVAAYGLAKRFDEWVGRLVPACYAVAGLLLLLAMVRRYRGPTAALLAGGLYGLLPLNLIFANMIDHEQGCIFWSLALLYAYLRWLDEGRRRDLVAILVSVCMAAQFDWPGYYLAFFLATHALQRALAVASSDGETAAKLARYWNRYTRFLLLFSLVVLASCAGFFLWARLLQGSLGDMQEAFLERSQPTRGYLAQQLGRLADLQGWFPLALLVGWGGLALARLQRRQSRPLDFVVAAFLFAQALHSYAFSRAGYIHSYWTYYLGPALGVAGGDFLVETWSHIPRLRHARAVHVAAVLLTVALFAYQAVYAFRQLRWGFRSGHAAYHGDEYDDQFAELMWARELGRRFPRPTTIFFVDKSVQRRRIEFDFYLDGPIFPRPKTATTLHRLWLLDMQHLGDAPERLREVERRSRLHPVQIWDSRFVVLDLGYLGRQVRSFVSAPQPTSIWWRWLVNPDRPAVRWTEMRDPGALQRLLATVPH